jgi:twitching motility protein PilI
MANKEALRELQGRLAHRLREARTEQRQRGWLAVECASRGFLLPLHEAGEIYPVAPVQRVAHTHPWFAGVANLRGGLHGVVDLAAFLGLDDDVGERNDSRFVGFNPALELNCALLIDRLAGLRNETQLTPDADQALIRPAFVGVRFRDAKGRAWQELNLEALADDPLFRNIHLPAARL